MKKFLITFLVIIIVILVISVSCTSFLKRQIERTKEELTAIEEVDIARVRDHRISHITITRHVNGQGKDAERIVDDMKKLNTVNVELVSGATFSTLVIRAAVSDALAKGI